MRGYWKQPGRTAEAFFTDAGGRRWYRTGDLVRRAPDDPECFIYAGRRDRMVKRRGYRVELGEIEAAFHRFDGVREAAAVAAPDADSGVRVWLFYSWKSGAGAAPSSLRLRQHAAKYLPAYMIPDVFRNVEALPMTTTDKVDYQTLSHLARTP
jgi:acyl-coenzyme A synthetase/AMP-(fatty) acid ligase